MGVDSESLFPAGAAQERVYRAGYNALLDHNWMTKDAESGKHSLKIELLRYVDTLVNPRFVISTELREQTQPPHRLIHYIGRKRIIEQAFLGKPGYRLTDVDEIQFAMLRINRAIETPSKSRLGDHQVQMNDDVFAKIKSLADAGDVKKALPALTKLGLSRSAAQGALISLSQPKKSGTITTYQLSGNQIEDLNALAFFMGEGGGWVAIKPDPKDSSLTLRTIDESQMWGLIALSLGDLMQQSAAT